MNNRLLVIVVSLVASAAMVYALSQVHWRAFLTTLASIPWWVWALSVFGLSASHWLRAGRLKAEWRSQLSISWQQAWGIVVRHTAWVVFTPFRGGEAIYVWALHRQGGVSLKDATMSLIALRIQDAWVLGVFSLTLITPLAWPLKICFLVGLLFTGVFFWTKISTMIQRIKARKQVNQNEISLSHSAGLGKPSLTSWFFAISNWIVKGFAIALPLTFLLPIDWISALKGAAGGELAAVLPIQPPAGAGLYEAGVLSGVLFQMPPNVALSWDVVIPAAVAVHGISLLVIMVSAFVARITGWSQSNLMNNNPIQTGHAIDALHSLQRLPPKS